MSLVMSDFGLPVGDGVHFVKALAFSKKCGLAVCIVGNKICHDERCFVRTLVNPHYIEVNVPFSVVCFALFEDQIVFAGFPNGKIQKCGTYDLASQSMRVGDLDFQLGTHAGEIVWISYFLSSHDEGHLHCRFTQQSVVEEHGRKIGNVVLSIGSLRTSDFNLTPLMRLEEGIA